MAGLLLIADRTVTVEPGGEATLVCRIKNTGGVVDQFSLQVLGAAAAFTTGEPPSLSLFPGAEGEIALRLNPPATQRAGQVPLGVKLLSAVEPQATIVEEATLQIGAFVGVTARLVPRTRRGRSVGKHELVLRNTGNTPVRLRVNGSDPDDVIRFRGLGAAPIALDPAQVHRLGIRYRSSAAHMTGPPENHEFTLSVVPEGGSPVPVQGSFLQRAAISGLMIMSLVAVVAVVVLVLVLKSLQSSSVTTQTQQAGAGAVGDATTTAVPATAVAPTSPQGTGGGRTPAASPAATPKVLPLPAQPASVKTSVPLLFTHTTGLSSGDMETVAGATEVDLTNKAALDFQSASYSPDGTRVAFSARDAGNPNSRDLEIGDSRLAGAQPIVLACGCTQVAWAYDGSLIAYVNGATIDIVPPDGSVGPRLIVTASAPISSLAWTRDSQRIAFGSGGQLAWITRNGGNPTPMANGGVAAGLSFSPDGRSVVFAMAPSGSTNPQILVADMDPNLVLSNQRALVAAGTNQFPKWSRDGRTIYYGGSGGVGGTPNFELWSIAAAGGGPSQLTHSSSSPTTGNVSSSQPEA